ncbi:MAG: hypothetical protein JNM88_20730 [Chitinophagaceae bacterium]|nr:hypothetical protein [Chitinophagaceae bacterium]
MTVKLALFIILVSFAIINYKSRGKYKLLKIGGVIFGMLTLLFHYVSENNEWNSILIPVKTINQTPSALNIHLISFYDNQRPIVKQVKKLNPGDTSSVTAGIDGVSEFWMVATRENGDVEQIMKKEEREYELLFQITGNTAATTKDKELTKRLIKRFRFERSLTWLLIITSIILTASLLINRRKRNKDAQGDFG